MYIIYISWGGQNNDGKPFKYLQIKMHETYRWQWIYSYYQKHVGKDNSEAPNLSYLPELTRIHLKSKNTHLY